MAFVLEPSRPLDAWLAEATGWLERSPGFFVEKPVLLNVREAVTSKEELAGLVVALAERSIRVMGLEGADPAWLDTTLPPAIGGGRGASLIEVLPETVAAAQSPANQSPANQSPAAQSPTRPPRPERPGRGDTRAGDRPSARTTAARQTTAPDGASADAPGGRPGATPVATPTGAGLVIDHSVRSGQTISHPGDVTIVGSVASGAEIVAGGSIHVYGALRGRAVAGSGGDGRARVFARRFEAELVAIDGHYRTAEDFGTAPRGRMVQVSVIDGALAVTVLE
jgi:septum site-determining protein MinC